MMRAIRSFDRGTMTLMSLLRRRFSTVLVAVAVVSAGACSSSPGTGGQGGSGGGAFYTGCASTYTAQVAKPLTCDTGTTNGRQVTTGTCGSSPAWQTFRDGSFYLIIECVYDAAGTLVGTRFCTDTGCMSAGQTVDPSSCTLGPDLCAAVDGGGAG